MNRCMACHADCNEVAFAQLMGDADGRRSSDALREHECQVRHLVRYMVRRKRLLADPTDDNERRREQKRLRKRLQTDRRAESY